MTFFDRGKGNKAILQSMRETNGEYNLVQLSDRHIQALLSITEYLKWSNRYSFLPEEFNDTIALVDWASDLEDRLMHPYEEGESVPVDCESVINCVIDAISNNEDFKDLFGEELTPIILTENNYNTYVDNRVYPSPTSPIIAATVGQLDLIWARCVAIVEFVHTRIMQLMAILETQSNNLELLQNVEAIPFLGTLFDELQLDAWLEMVDYMLGIWKEQYEANWTTDPPISEEDPEMGSKWVLCCALFCTVKEDGVFTVDRINDAFRSCFTSSLPSTDNVAEFIQFLIGINDDNPNVVYGSFVVVWGIAKLTSQLVNDKITAKFLSAVLRLTDEGNNDWQVYCLNCTETVVCLDFKESDWGFSVISSLGEYIADSGFEDTYIQGSPGNSYRGIAIGRTFETTIINDVQAEFAISPGYYENTGDDSIGIYFYLDDVLVGMGHVLVPNVPNNGQSFTINQECNRVVFFLMSGVLVWNGGPRDPLGSITLDTLCIEYTGVNPFD